MILSLFTAWFEGWDYIKYLAGIFVGLLVFALFLGASWKWILGAVLFFFFFLLFVCIVQFGLLHFKKGNLRFPYKTTPNGCLLGIASIVCLFSMIGLRFGLYWKWYLVALFLLVMIGVHRWIVKVRSSRQAEGMPTRLLAVSEWGVFCLVVVFIIGSACYYIWWSEISYFLFQESGRILFCN